MLLVNQTTLLRKAAKMTYPLNPTQKRIVNEVANEYGQTWKGGDDNDFSVFLSIAARKAAEAGRMSHAWSYYQNDPLAVDGVTYDQFERSMREQIKRHKENEAALLAHSVAMGTDAPPKPSHGHGVEVGDVFACSWGWEQTNVDFYKVTKVTATQVTVVELESKAIEYDDRTMTGKRVPSNDVKENKKPIRRKIFGRKSDESRPPMFKPESYSGAHLWDGKPQRFSCYG